MKHILLIFLVSVLSACATLTAEVEQDITLTTNPEGALCVIRSSTEEWTIAATPGIATVPRAFEPLEVVCTLEGYQPKMTVIEAKTRARSWGNILLGGIPGLVDAKTGAGYEYEPGSLGLTLVPVAPY